MRIVLPIALAVALSSCAIASQTYGPDGRQSVSISCNGLANDWGKCYEKAGNICGSRGYDIVSRNGDEGAIATANSNGAFGGSVITRNIVVSCK